MKKTLMTLMLLLPIAACSQTQQGALVGGLGGAAVGSLVSSPENRAQGALVGGALGAVAGGVVGHANEPRYPSARHTTYERHAPGDRYRDGRRVDDRKCLYVDRRGYEYVADCAR